MNLTTIEATDVGIDGRSAGRLLFRLFETAAEAAQTVEDAIRLGAPRDGISLLARQGAGPSRALRAMSMASAAVRAATGAASADERPPRDRAWACSGGGWPS